MNLLDETDDTQAHQAPLHHDPSHPQLIDTTNEPMQNYDGSEMRDSNSQLVYKSQFLSTHPLWSDCKERVGYGGKKFTYVSGDGVIRNMNAIFGHGASDLIFVFVILCSLHVILQSTYLMCTFMELLCCIVTQ